MRGTQPFFHLHSKSGGIIPADAGNTAEMDVSHVNLQDHPRGCGEHDDSCDRR